MKQIQVPYIDDLEYLSLSELERILEEKGEKIYVDQVNWPDSYPYMPSTSVLVARTSSSLVLFYQVRGHDIRASLLDDNEMVCTDSCCEFFVQDPHDGTYYNFEVNCIGTLKAAKRRSRAEFDLFDQEQLSRVVRMTSLPRELFSSSVNTGIPFLDHMLTLFARHGFFDLEVEARRGIRNRGYRYPTSAAGASGG